MTASRPRPGEARGGADFGSTDGTGSTGGTDGTGSTDGFGSTDPRQEAP